MKTASTDYQGGRKGFTLMEVLVAMGLMSLIVFVLMSVFSSTQSAFRSGVTQTDVLEGGRNAIEQMSEDVRGLTASAGFYNGAVNVYCTNNTCMFMTLPASAVYRTNVLQAVFFLSKQNTAWIGTGYVVPPCYGNSFNGQLFPLYRYNASATLQQGPYTLYTNFMAALNINQRLTNTLYWSHLMDGVVQLVVRGYDPYGIWITNGYTYYSQTNNSQWPAIRNTLYSAPYPGLGGEVGFTMYSNNLPAAVDVQMGVLEDTALRRLQSMVNINPTAYSNYLSTNSASKMQFFRQHVTVPNCDLSAYQ